MFIIKQKILTIKVKGHELALEPYGVMKTRTVRDKTSRHKQIS